MSGRGAGRRWQVVAGIGGIAIVVGAIVWAVAATRSEPDAGRDNEVGTRIYFVGDSLSANWYASAPGRGFVETSTEALGATQVGLVAKPGATIAAAATLLESSTTAPAEVVVVELGTNDLAQRVAVGTSVEAYAGLVRLAKQHAPGARLVCLGPWVNAKLGSALDAALRQACSRAGGVFVSLLAAYERTSNRGPIGSASYLGPRDYFHPNDRGHAAIARRVEVAVRSVSGGPARSGSAPG